MKHKRMTWRELQAVDPQILDSWWTFSKRGVGGDVKFHGNCIPQVVLNTSLRYTVPGDVAWDPMCGSGTALDVWEKLNVIGVGSDLVSIRPDIWKADARFARLWGCGDDATIDVWVRAREECPSYSYSNCYPVAANFLFLHPPYADIVSFNPDHPDELSNIHDMDEFVSTMDSIVDNLARSVALHGYVVLLCGDIYKDSAVFPLSNILMEQWRRLPEFTLKNHIVKNMSGNRFNAKRVNLYYSRHARFDTSRFMHEDVWVFRKA